MEFPFISDLVDGGARGIDISTGVFIGPRAAFPIMQSMLDNPIGSDLLFCRSDLTQ